MRPWQLERRGAEAILLAAIGLISVSNLRYPIESLWFSVELSFAVVCFVALVFALKHERPRIARTLAATLVATPILFALIARQAGSPVAFEMTALTLIGVAALAMSVGQARVRASSLVASGFLTLFATVISDNPYSIGLAILWMTICVWHLVANHWERIEVCTVETVTRRGQVRPMSVILGVVVFAVAGWAAKDRFWDSTRLQGGFMPVSGGSKWSDDGALSGVGTGDAAIAAKDHAESFGAVDSELFLESTDSTLFDMFSDSLGQPKKKNVWERRQGLSSEKVIEAHSRTAKSEKGGSSFSTERHPPKKHLHLEDATGNAAVQWAGPTGIRLAMNRYDTYDGSEWTNNAKHLNERLVQKPIGDQIWFFDPKTAHEALTANDDGVSVSQLKIIRLDSTRLPVPMMTSGVHIKKIDRQDFYAIDNDGSFFMPGRVRVPALTVVHVAHLKLLEDDLIKQLSKSYPSPIRSETPPKLGGESPGSAPLETSAAVELSRLVDAWTRDHKTRHEKLRAIVGHLRSEFTLDREVDFGDKNSLSEFLRTKRGGNDLFATTATLMAREIGLRSRLVTGFYVRPSALEIAAGHSNVLPTDVHVWAEIQLDGDHWFEIEPTPGYREPVYSPSWSLATRRFLAANWPIAAVTAVVGGIVYATRLIWIEWILRLVWWLSFPVSLRRRLALAMRILELRARVLCRPRPQSSPPRDWLLGDLVAGDLVDRGVRRRAESFCDLADQLCFGNQTPQLAGAQRKIIGGIVDDLPIRTLQKYLSKERP